MIDRVLIKTIMEVATKPVYIKHSDLRESNKKHLNLLLCEALNNHVPNHIVADQHIGGVWLILIKTEGAREYLMKKVITCPTLPLSPEDW